MNNRGICHVMTAGPIDNLTRVSRNLPSLWFGLVATLPKKMKNVDCWSAHCYALADGKIGFLKFCLLLLLMFFLGGV